MGNVDIKFKGGEIFESSKGIYEYTGVVHDDKKVYGVLVNSEPPYNEECFNFDEILTIWTEKSELDISFLCDLVKRFTNINVQPHAIKKCIEVMNK